MTHDHTPLDLDKLEAEAKEQLRPCNDGTPKRLHHTILALIFELRQAKEGMVMWQNASIKINEHLTSAEEALGFYASDEAYEGHEGYDGSTVLLDGGRKAEAVLKKFEEWDKRD